MGDVGDIGDVGDVGDIGDVGDEGVRPARPSQREEGGRGPELGRERLDGQVQAGPGRGGGGASRAGRGRSQLQAGDRGPLGPARPFLRPASTLGWRFLARGLGRWGVGAGRAADRTLLLSSRLTFRCTLRCCTLRCCTLRCCTLRSSRAYGSPARARCSSDGRRDRGRARVRHTSAVSPEALSKASVHRVSLRPTRASRAELRHRRCDAGPSRRPQRSGSG